MDMEQIRAIVAEAGTWAASIVAGLGGFTGIIALIRACINARSAAKLKKLTDADKKEIANEVVTEIKTMVGTGIKIDMSAKIDEATNKRIKAIEEAQNANAKVLDKSLEYHALELATLTDFQRVTTEHRSAILKAIEEVADESAQAVEMEIEPVLVVEKKEDTEKRIETQERY